MIRNTRMLCTIKAKAHVIGCFFSSIYMFLGFERVCYEKRLYLKSERSCSGDVAQTC